MFDHRTFFFPTNHIHECHIQFASGAYSNSYFNNLRETQHSMYSPCTTCVVFLATVLWSEIIFIEETERRKKDAFDLQMIFPPNRN